MSYLLKKRARFELVTAEGRDYKKFRTVKCPQVDLALADWFLYCQTRRFKIPGDLVRHKARVFYELLAPQLSENVTSSPPQFSNGWMHSFMSRHGFSLGGSKGNTRDRTLRMLEDSDGRPKFAAETSVISTPNHFKAAVMGIAPENVYWLHETKLFYAMSPDRQALPTGHHPDKKLTMLLAVNADGSDRLKPLFVGPHALPEDDSMESEERSYQFTCNHKAWMPPTLLRNWLMALDWRMRVTERHIVLIIDSVSAMSVQKTILSNVKMHFIERNHAGELCVRPLEMGIVSSVKRRYRYQLLDFALDQREEGQVNIYDVPLQKVVKWLAQAWRQIPRSRIMAAFANVGVVVTPETEADIVPDNRSDDRLDAQIQALLKRLKLINPMRLIEVVAPSAERACDEDLTDADFADAALHASQSLESMQSGTDTLTCHAITSATDLSSRSTIFTSSDASNLSSNHPGYDQGNPDSLDESWLAWTVSQGTAIAPVRQPITDLEAVQTTIRLATDMNCDSTVIKELNRILNEVAIINSSPLTTPSQMTDRVSRSICKFHYGVPTRRLL
ncbi:putative DDE superfamily endonuclease domain, HTH CenpB-type DNA-binding domain-containing protein [Plasmopara halstedii]